MASKKGKSRSVYFKNVKLWEKIDFAAADEMRSVNNWLETLLTNHFLNQEVKK